MKSVFVYFFFVIGITIWISVIFSKNHPNSIKFIPTTKYYPEEIMDNKIKTLFSKFVTQQKLNEIDTQIIKQNLKIIKTKQTQKNEFNYQNDQRYYAEWH